MDQYQYHEENVKKHPFLKDINIDDQDMIDNARTTGESKYTFYRIDETTEDIPNVCDKCAALESFMMLYNKDIKTRTKLNGDPETRPLQFKSQDCLRQAEFGSGLTHAYDCSIFKEIKSNLTPS